MDYLIIIIHKIDMVILEAAEEEVQKNFQNHNHLK